MGKRDKELPKCPITRADFAADAKPIRCDLHLPGIGLRTILLMPKTFKRQPNMPGGSMGWRQEWADEKAVAVIAGVPSKLQINFSLYVVGSNQLPETEEQGKE